MMHVFAGSVLRWPAPSYSHALRLPGSCALSSGDLLHACCADCWVHTVSATRFPMRSEHRTVFDRIRVCLYKLDFIAIAPGLWWQQRGLGLRIDDAEAAGIRATASAGVHFSFEKVDRVTRSTICGRFEPSRVSEQVLHRQQLVSFALTEDALAAAREEVSGPGQEEATVAEELDAAAAREVAALAAAQLAQRTARQAAEESYQRVVEKRERSKQAQALKKKKR